MGSKAHRSTYPYYATGRLVTWNNLLLLIVALAMKLAPNFIAKRDLVNSFLQPNELSLSYINISTLNSTPVVQIFPFALVKEYSVQEIH